MYPYDSALTFHCWQYQQHSVATAGLPAGHLEAYRQQVRRLIWENVNELSDAENRSLLDQFPGEPESKTEGSSFTDWISSYMKRRFDEVKQDGFSESVPPEMPEGNLGVDYSCPEGWSIVAKGDVSVTENELRVGRYELVWENIEDLTIRPIYEHEYKQEDGRIVLPLT